MFLSLLFSDIFYCKSHLQYFLFTIQISVFSHRLKNVMESIKSALKNSDSRMQYGIMAGNDALNTAFFNFIYAFFDYHN